MNLQMAVRADFPRWTTIAGGIGYAAVASVATIISFFQWKEAELGDLALVLLIAAGWAWLWTGIVRFLDALRHQALGLLLLILFATVTIANNMFNISETNTPVAINSFPYGGLLNLDLRDVVNVVGIAAMGVSTVVSVLRPSRLSAVYDRLRSMISTIRGEPVKWIAILGGVL